MAKCGNPLVEAAGAKGRSLVTFVWRGDDKTRNVVVLGGGAPGDPSDNRMERLEGSNVWFRTYDHRSDARFRYALSVNDDMRPLESVPASEKQKRLATVRVDPLNLNRARISMIPMFDASLPDAPPQPYIVRRPDVPAGRIEERVFRSNGVDRAVFVYRPANAAGKLPLVVLFDGSSYASDRQVAETIDNLIAEGKVRPLMAAMLNPAAGQRQAELACNAEFVRMLAAEFIPWMRSEYAVADEPVTVGGASRGGLGAAFAALRRPEVFGAVISQSGSFEWKPDGDKEPQWLVNQYAAASKVRTRFFVEAGLMETDRYEGGPSLLESNRRMRDVLRAKGAQVLYSEFNGDHTPLNWRGSFADALMWLYAPGR
jgi:enterochelin esterase family protein